MSSIKSIYLSDYQIPDYLIENTYLTVDLFEDYTLVRAKLLIQRNSEETETFPALILNGQLLELLSISLNGKLLSEHDYQLTDSHLCLQPEQASFELETLVRIYPQNNTALEGLYKSSKMFCTQCEAEGFRRITYYLDRPDVMSRFTVMIKADQKQYPILLSNGNLVSSGKNDDGRHWAKWEDPFKKPAYLFALVAGDLWCVEDTFITQSQREITLRIYVESENIDKCQHAMDSLKKAMQWDEEKYGREYDLDIFMIVAVNDFNMGAMENKGLNIFNSSCVLANAEATTDDMYQRIESIVAHEYFHNWSGNRVTCRDWFQLSLKEGFTVFRDTQFSSDMNTPVIKRIEDVSYLRSRQFSEDAGPMAHPIRPASFIEISNFYTVTVYEKGAEVVRMIHTLVGDKGFRKGSDLYFDRHDGQAVTCEDFVHAMETANNIDLTAFSAWYSQAGTPELSIKGTYDKDKKTYQLNIKQSCPDTPESNQKRAFVIPIKMGLLGAYSKQPLTLVIVLRTTEQNFIFKNVLEEPVPSLLRNFSAPVKLYFDYSPEQLLTIMQHDIDMFNRWNASQQLAVLSLQYLIRQYQQKGSLLVDPKLLQAYRSILNDKTLDQAIAAQFLTLPTEAYLAEISDGPIDVDAIHHARLSAQIQIADALFDDLWTCYQSCYTISRQSSYQVSTEHFARRKLQNVALSYLMLSENSIVTASCVRQFNECDNMTERLAAFTSIVNSSCSCHKEYVINAFVQLFNENPQAMDLWLSAQAACYLPDGLDRIQKLMQHSVFTLSNPNRVRAVLGSFSNQNMINFHKTDGSGYHFLVDQILLIDKLNPQLAARLLTPLINWKRYDCARKELMKIELNRIASVEGLSVDTYEIVSKSLMDA
ncbi:UNVERIFIED_CONTAM: hypothetical protein GTU68_041663 [Idotea baltica]|nr:hypothetical protein [Idotea baltica]